MLRNGRKGYFRKEKRIMSKGETIAYAIKKQCSEFSLSDWCEEWDFTIEEFDHFLALGRDNFDEEDMRDRNYYE